MAHPAIKITNAIPANNGKLRGIGTAIFPTRYVMLWGGKNDWELKGEQWRCCCVVVGVGCELSFFLFTTTVNGPNRKNCVPESELTVTGQRVSATAVERIS